MSIPARRQDGSDAGRREASCPPSETTPLPLPPSLPFTLPRHTVEVAAPYLPLDVAAAVERLVDPGAAVKTLHWGRNYLYLARLETAGGPVEMPEPKQKG